MGPGEDGNGGSERWDGETIPQRKKEGSSITVVLYCQGRDPVIRDETPVTYRRVNHVEVGIWGWGGVDKDRGLSPRSCLELRMLGL